MSVKRSLFNSDEKLFLKELVGKYQHLIENKKSDCVSLADKKKAWVRLTEECNSMAENNNRNTDQLRKYWENMKSRGKKDLSEEKRCRMITGGGIFKPEISSDILIDDVLNCVDIEISDTIDSDNIIRVSEQGNISRGTNSMLNEDIPVDEPTTSNVLHCSNDLQQPGIVFSPSVDHTYSHVPPSKIIEGTPRASKKKQCSNSYTARGTAIERELEVELQRNELLKEQEAELHNLRAKQLELKLQDDEEEAQFNRERRRIILEQEKLKLSILKEQLLQLKTEKTFQ